MEEHIRQDVNAYVGDSYKKDHSFLSRSFASKEEFIRRYNSLYSEKSKAEKLYIVILIEIEKSISEGNVHSLSRLSILIDYINEEEELTVKNYYNNRYNPIKNTNLVILACKHNEVKILEFLFSSSNNILSHFSVGVGKNFVSPDDKDEIGHNAFYYAIRSGNTELLDILIKKWPDNYFVSYSEKLDEILSTAYEELKLKHVLLTSGMQIFVENELINIRFFSDNSSKKTNVLHDINNIKDRIELVLLNINLLNTEYSATEKVDEKFLYIIKFIAQNIHILKRFLKSSYSRLPWEEIEFCLVSFVSSLIKQQWINLFYCAVLNKHKIIRYLMYFAKQLEKEKNIIGNTNIKKLAILPNDKREKITQEIINNFSNFQELYTDYQKIRDFHSLRKINDYIQLASSANPKEKAEQLIITRVIQIIGEYLKNTLESPKLSSVTSEHLLLTLSKDVLNIFADLRNSFSHSSSLFKRTEIEQKNDVKFFIGIQNDIKKVGDVVSKMLYNNSIKTIRILVEKVVQSENVDELKDIVNLLSRATPDNSFYVMSRENLKMTEYERLENLNRTLMDNITDVTDYQKEIFEKVNSIISAEKAKSTYNKTDFFMGYMMLPGLSRLMTNFKVDHNIVKGIKYRANTILQIISPQTEPNSFKEIAELIITFWHTADMRQYKNTSEVFRLMYEFLYIFEYETNDVNWMEELRENLKQRSSIITAQKQSKCCSVKEKIKENLLALKLSELSNILKVNALDIQLTQKFLPSYEYNKKLQAIIEMIVLDTMSILGDSKYCLENNVLFLDGPSPLLIGKYLRNHLAHDNTLVDILSSDPSLAIVLNARKLVTENILTNRKKIGKLIKEDICTLKAKYDQDLITITNQEKMFIALAESDLEDLQDCIKKGADVYARNIKNWTTLHFAAKGTSLSIVKYLLDQNLDINATDISGQTVLHIAATYGRNKIVEFLVEKMGMCTDDTDKSGKTALHLAAWNGHISTIEVLLKNNANILIKDTGGAAAVHCAVRHNHIAIVKMLLIKDENVDANETKGGYTSLHEAAEFGHQEIVNFLIQNGAKINAKTDKDWIPLHAAAFNGHLEVVNSLISKGADINARVKDGCTSLYYAAESGHDKIANILLKHGANADIVDTIYSNTPLHIAARYGYDNIVKSLLSRKTKVDVTNFEGMTPLCLSARYGHLGVVAILIDYGADIDYENSCPPLYNAVEAGHIEIVEFLIKNKANVNIKNFHNFTPLHVAAVKGHKNISEYLIKNKAEVNVQGIDGRTPLHTACLYGNMDTVHILIKNKADINIRSYDAGNTPLHVAAIRGQRDILAFLIKCKAEINVRNNYSATPLHLAVMRGNKDVVNILIKNGAQINDPVLPVLQPAIETGHTEVAKILIENGADADSPLLISAIKQNRKELVEILIKNGVDINFEHGTPLHVAVVSRNKDIVEILLKNKASVNVRNIDNATPLHRAAGAGHTGIVKSLIKHGADVNALTTNEATPFYFAVLSGHEEIVEILLKESNTKKIFKTKHMEPPLHVAVTHGYKNIVRILLEHQAVEVNEKDYKNRTPLEMAVAHGQLDIVKMLIPYMHYAAKFSHFKIVRALLSNGAVHNIASKSGKTPLNLSSDKNIIKLLGLVAELFRNIETGNTHVISKINRIKDIDTVRAIMNAHNEENRTLTTVALRLKFSQVEELKQVKQGNISTQINMALAFFHYGKYNEALSIFKSVLETRKEIFSLDDPSILDIQEHIASTLYKQGYYENALNILEDIFLKKKNMLGLNDTNTLRTRSTIALVMHRQERNEEAISIFKEVYNRQNEILGPNHPETVITQVHMALVLNKLGNFQEALDVNKKVLETINKTSGLNDINTVHVQNNIAMALSNQGKYEEALDMYKEVLKEKQNILGNNHPDTLRTLHHIATIFVNQEKYHEALKALYEILDTQKSTLGSTHPETLNTQCMIGEVYFSQGKWINAFEAYREIQNKKTVFNENYSNVSEALMKMEFLKGFFKYDGGFETLEVTDYLQQNINTAVANGDIQTVRRLLKDGAKGINDRDSDGRISLHYAVSNGDISIVNMLLENGADITQVTKKGNTALHLASSKGFKDIVETLLQHVVSSNKLNNFLNAKTSSKGTTSLHAAAEYGSLEIVKSLLKHGAVYNIENKEGKIPTDVSRDFNVINLLKLIETCFENVKNGELKFMKKLETLEVDELAAVTHTRNMRGNTLLQVAATNGHTSIAKKILEMIKKAEQSKSS